MIEIDCIGALAVVTAVLSYRLYQERQKTTGVEISVGVAFQSKRSSFAFAGEAVDKCQRKYGG